MDALGEKVDARLSWTVGVGFVLQPTRLIINYQGHWRACFRVY